LKRRSALALTLALASERVERRHGEREPALVAMFLSLHSRPMGRTEDDLAGLVDRLRRGDLAALGEAYDAHHEHVRAFARRLLGDDAAAEDLVQETFLALPGAMRRYRGDAPLRTFLVGVAANHGRHHARGAARRRAAHERSGMAEAEAGRIPPSPEDEARRQELAAALLRALDALPFEQRVAIVLCEVEERTSAEAARIVGVPEATIRTRIFHGKRKLREALEKEGVR
jgi:RNA polymerase sigma-70 factor (ECF subfamily)